LRRAPLKGGKKGNRRSHPGEAIGSQGEEKRSIWFITNSSSEKKKEKKKGEQKGKTPRASSTFLGKKGKRGGA